MKQSDQSDPVFQFKISRAERYRLKRIALNAEVTMQDWVLHAVLKALDEAERNQPRPVSIPSVFSPEPTTPVGRLAQGELATGLRPVTHIAAPTEPDDLDSVLQVFSEQGYDIAKKLPGAL